MGGGVRQGPYFDFFKLIFFDNGAIKSPLGMSFSPEVLRFRLTEPFYLCGVTEHTREQSVDGSGGTSDGTPTHPAGTSAEAISIYGRYT